MIMRRPISATLFPVLLAALLSAGFAMPRAQAAEGHDAGTKSPAAEAPSAPSGGETPAASPWEHPLWSNATTMMRIYLCDHARRPPSWCGAPQELPANGELPPIQGPPLVDEDAVWLAFLDGADPTNMSQEDVETVRLRAIRRRDPQAMEILGFIYAEGVSVERDYAESYRWYGLAYLAGEQRVRPNMEIVWQQLQRHDLEAALALTRQFNALQAGEVPESLVMGVEQGADMAESAPAADSGDSKAPAQ
ncbi:SEL1-like repeat protein [Pelagibius marinus]|uniref:SEL1-like repeat protein n=1 Tax=Pelagibius marinus TaxID=2762760 RepID=UPI001872745D|nr:SEL1-like repeat protein [Pelagibius marinus]